MVIGLDLFEKYFDRFSDRYVLIGGTACELAMNEVGLSFRATKDLDIVLCVESLDKEFAKVFWKFIKDGGYRSKGIKTGKQQYYRFKKPDVVGFPFMIELFSRIPDTISISERSHLTPIPVDDDVSSLSAILLNQEYFKFIINGRKLRDKLSFAGADRLIPLKAKAWLDLSARKKSGESVDSKDIKKHRNDIFRLYQILSPDFDEELPVVVRDDLDTFLSIVKNEDIDIEALGLGTVSLGEILNDIQKIFNII
ncbi:MAG: hypothetical protein ACYTFY_13650 [Planctomycetota bacterium]|jgi:hypothetical protein